MIWVRAALAKRRADQVNGVPTQKLAMLCTQAIEEACKQGYYTCIVQLGGFVAETTSEVKSALEAAGYTVRYRKAEATSKGSFVIVWE